MGAPRMSGEHPEFVPKSKQGAKNSKTRQDPKVLQDRVVSLIEEGLTVRSAMAKVGRSEETYKYWRRNVDGFADKADRARAKLAGSYEGPGFAPFDEWREKYLNIKTFPHQSQWIDVLENREPRGLHESMTYIKGRPQRVMINTPPFHAKSTTITIDYVAYRICMDPTVRIIIISESRDMARKMLVAIKHRLTHPDYEKMHQDYGPAGGFKVGAPQWTTDAIRVLSDSPEKDPTVEVLGVGSQIYGARADLIIMDDCVTLKSSRTAGQAEKLIEFIDQDVSSRLDSKNGKLLLVGTRVGPSDVYRRLLKRDADKGKKVWTLLAQPAVLEYAEEDDEWETLWPFLWDGESLAIRRDEIDTTTWNLVYQQQQVDEDSVFPEEAVNGCMYFGHTGPLQEDGMRPGGMNGLYVVAGLDPATAGHTGIIVLGVDKRTRMRWVLDVYNIKGMTPHRLRETISLITAKFPVNEWRIEKNGLQQMISQDPEIRDLIHKGGGRIVEHHTGQNKWDPKFGVMSLAPLFLGALGMPKKNLIAIPNDSKHRGVKSLVDQLISWSPDGVGKTDLVMALWFADLGARKALDVNTDQTHMDNKWATKGQQSRRRVIDLNKQQEEEHYSVF